MAAICKIRDGSMLIHRAGGQHAGEVIEAWARTSGRAVASPGCGADKGLEDPLTGPRLLKANLRTSPLTASGCLTRGITLETFRRPSHHAHARDVKAQVRTLLTARMVGKIDEAHLLSYEQLESVRMLTLCRDRDYAGDLHELPGSATVSRPTVPA
jgi:hypothetical protein